MKVLGIVSAINQSDNMYNLIVKDKESNVYNLKINPSNSSGIKIGRLYEFICDEIVAERISYRIKEFKDAESFELEKRDQILREFYKSSPIEMKDAKEIVYSYIEKIDNKNIKDITLFLLKKYNDEYFIYPAAAKMHHAFIGGLAYHSIGMLKMSDGFINNYDYLNKDYIYAGIILHDIGKAIELSGVINTEYTISGQLLGHLVIGAMEIENAAINLGIKDSKEALLLEHMLISHHGLPQFGSPKKPMTAEALVLWYIDTIDSKFRVLGEELAKTKSDEFTEAIGVLDRSKIYKI